LEKKAQYRKVFYLTRKNEMVTMYHCKNTMCEEVKAIHYCVKQNQPEMLLDPTSTETKYIYNCDMSTAL